MHTIMVLGGYGFFGRRIAGALARDAGVRVLIAGRSREKAAAAAVALGLDAAQGVAVDAADPALDEVLRAHGADTLIHTAGPFQGQDYAVAQAAIAAGSHYIDLADGRDFVCGIGALDAQARARGVTVVSGASSVPALSGAVVDRYAGEFSRIDAIRSGIGSGARAPGIATVRGVFGYCGKPLRRWQAGAWALTHGWMDMRLHRFPAPVGARLLGACEVPDLSLFVQRYPGVRSVSFHAGFASAPGHLAVYLLAALVRLKLLPSATIFAGPLNRLSRWIEPLASDKGAMFVSIEGLGKDGAALTRTWNLIAERNHGPHIPCGASIALARKLARGDALPRGAMPCLGLFSVAEYLEPLRDLAISEIPA